MNYQAETSASAGELEKAREFSRRSADEARLADQKETVAEYQLNAAKAEAEFGNFSLARSETTAAQALAPTQGVNVWTALVVP